MRYCDANIPVMDKIFCLVKRVDYALLSSQPIINDEGSFGQMNGALCGVSSKLSTASSKSKEEFLSNDQLR